MLEKRLVLADHAAQQGTGTVPVLVVFIVKLVEGS